MSIPAYAICFTAQDASSVLRMGTSCSLGLILCPNFLQPVQAGYCAAPTLDNMQPYCSRAARLRNKSILELALLLYLFQVENTTLELWIVAVTTISNTQTGLQRIQIQPGIALYYIGTAASGNV